MKKLDSSLSKIPDHEMLQALIHDERLIDKDRHAFEGMLRTVTGGRKLSKPQRDWAEDAFKKYGLEVGFAENLVSSGEVVRGKEVKMLYENMPRPLKPPGR
jgi:hypothetical protein